MNVHERAEVMLSIFKNECIPLSIRKGIGYGEKDDAFANLREDGEAGINIRLADKVHRIKNLFKRMDMLMSGFPDASSEEDWESWVDNNLDIINYALYNLIMSRERLGLPLFVSDDEVEGTNDIQGEEA